MSLRRHVLAAASAVILALPATLRAQAVIDSANLALAHQLLEANSAAKTMLSMIQTGIPAQREANPRIPAEFWTRFEERVVNDSPGLIDSLAALYAVTFTRSELQGLLAFYQSTAGKRFVEAQPELLQQSMQLGRRWGERIGAEIVAGMKH